MGSHAKRWLQVMDEGDFEKAASKLREREYPYFLASNKDMIRIPSIGFVAMDAAYFNFVYYIAWKIVSQNVTGAEARTAFNRDVGRNMLRQWAAHNSMVSLISDSVSGVLFTKANQLSFGKHWCKEYYHMYQTHVSLWYWK